jgi:hypothetical protein
LLAVTLADLSFRARQFLIATVGVGLVLAMALLLTGLAAGFRAEVNGTVDGVGANSWVLAKSAQGRITAQPGRAASGCSQRTRERSTVRAKASR